MDSAPSHLGLEYILARITQDFMQFMRQSGLSTPQIHVLLHIYHSPNGECGLSEIGALADSSRPAASQLVERLVQQRLVQRLEDPRDRRNKKLRLTQKSRKLIQNSVTSNRFLTDLMSSLPSNQRATVHAAFEYLAQASLRIQPTHKLKDDKHA